MEKEYILSFSSFYKAAYAQDMLDEEGIRSTLKKLPAELVRSCGTGLYLRIDSIQPVQEALARKEIVPRGIFQIQRQGGAGPGSVYEKGQKTFVKVK